MAEMIQSILAIGKQTADQATQKVDLNQILQVELEILQFDSFFKNQVKLTKDLGIIPTIEGRSIHFNQIFGNLIKNAIESMREKEVRELRVFSRAEDQSIVVEIADTGCGISLDHLPKIFDPYFSTKSLSVGGNGHGGTGLGLMSVRRTLQIYNATIDVDSVHGEKTIVRVKLPLTEKKATQS